MNIISDKNMLRSILQNFMTNAIRYTSGGSVMLVCRKKAGQLCLEVRDSGIGIAKENLDAVFEEYHQLDSNMSEGLGLGLAITKRVSGLLNHPMGVRSEQGKGSVFHVSVPIVDGEVVANISHQEGDISADFLAGRVVLCIDDEANITEALTELLQRWGANVYSAQNYEEYQTLLQEGYVFDVILADYHLNSSWVGLDILKHYQQQTIYKFFGVLITAEQNSTIEDEALLAEFSYLTKPVDSQLLKNILYQHFNQ
jgi:CheY-like chemotaxis protein/anti-sigma regulatory factor (Ser/Thr protein kinase)